MAYYHILLVDDSSEDRATIKRLLRQATDRKYIVSEAGTAQLALYLCLDQAFDCILLDYKLPDVDGFELLSRLRDQKPLTFTPIIMLAGQGSEAIAVGALKGGAQDYLTKNEISTERLHMAIENAISTMRLQQALKESEERYQALVGVTAQIIWRANSNGEAIFVTSGWQDLTGQTEEDMRNWGWVTAIHPNDRGTAIRLWLEALRDRKPYQNEYRVRASDGSYHDIEVRGIPIFNHDGSIREWTGTGVDITARKDAERALHRANERFILAAKAVQAIIFDWDIVTDQVMRTIGVFDVLGYTLEEINSSRQWWFDRIHPEDLASALAIVNHALENEDSYSVEHRMLHKNGAVVYIWEQGAIVRDFAGQPVRVVGSTIDITQMKLTQQRLEEQQAFISQIADNVSAIIYLYDVREKRNLYINDQITKLLGYAWHEIYGFGSNWMSSLIHPDDVTGFNHMLETLYVAEKSTMIQTEYRLKHKNGGWRWFVGHDKVLKYEADGQPLQVLGIAYDITERKQTEEQLIHSTELIRALIENTPDVIWAKDVEGRLTLGNQMLYKILGNGDPKQVLGRRADELGTDLEQARRVIESDNRVLTTGQPELVEDVIENVQPPRVFQSYKAPLYDRDGKIIGIMGISRDVTDIKQLETHKAELLRLEQLARRKAEEANRAKVEFIGMVTHDLRTPLASIKGFTTTLLADDLTLDAAQQRQFLEIIDEETNKLTEMTEQLMDISRIQAGTFSVQLEPVQIHSIFEFVEQELMTLSHNHRLVIRLPASLPAINADKKKLARVLVNLVGNAAKFSPPGSQIELGVILGEDRILFEVTDQGVGIPADKREMIFEPFAQLNTQQRGRGAGLGLAICKSVVEAHGGKIWIEDGVPRGTRMRFALEITPPDSSPHIRFSSPDNTP